MENKTGEKIIVLACFLIIIFVITLTVLSNNEVIAPGSTNTCDHEFVVSSEYDWWWRSYKTFSKCYKCGLEV